MTTAEDNHPMLPEPGLQSTEELALHRKPEADDFVVS